MRTATPDQLLNTSRMARALGVSPSNLSNMVARGQLPEPWWHAQESDRAPVWHIDDVRDLLTSRREQTIHKLEQIIATLEEV